MQITKATKKANSETVKMSSASRKLLSINRAKLAAMLSSCLVVVAALIVCSTQFKGTHEEQKQAMETEMEVIDAAQSETRQYVREQLDSLSGDTSKGAVLESYLFAKNILNAYDRPYQHVIEAVQSWLRELDAITGGTVDKETAKLKLASNVMADAYGRALVDSQKYSVLIQQDIRRSQEAARNKEGQRSWLEEALSQWDLQKLTDLESHLVNSYLQHALVQPD